MANHLNRHAAGHYAIECRGAIDDVLASEVIDSWFSGDREQT